MTSKQMSDVLTRVDERTKAIADDVAELKYAIHGNGTPGLKDRMTRLEERSAPNRMQLMKENSGLLALAVALAHVIERLVH